MIRASFSVVGVAQPQGSMRIVRHGRKLGLTSDNPKLHGWRDDVGRSINARLRAQLPTFDVGPDYPVSLAIVIALPRPKRPRSTAHLTRPDVDKLARGILDALTGLIYRDDAQVVSLAITKRYVTGSELPFVAVEVSIDDHASAAPVPDAPACHLRRSGGSRAHRLR